MLTIPERVTGYKRVFPLFFLCAVLCGCGADHRYEEAVKLEEQGMALKAADHYKLFAEKNPGDKNAPAALFRAGEIYSRRFGLCSRSKPVFERLLKNYSVPALKPAAMKGLFICPDYFPVDRPLAWTYGDSQSGGANATQITRVSGPGTAKVHTLTQIYAGKTLVARQKKFYTLSDLDLVEKDGGFDTIILKYPAEKGLSWVAAAGGRRTVFTVMDAGLRVKVRAGEFDNCIKVKRQMEGMSSWVYEYYAPWVGKILTSVAGKGYENRVTELLKYEETQKV